MTDITTQLNGQLEHEMRPAPPQLRRWAATAVVCLGLFLLGVDLTVLNVAVPDLQQSLRPSMSEVQWTVDGYALLLGGTVLSAGGITDRIGQRRAFIMGLLTCALASAAGAVADDIHQVVASRCGMGLGAALLMPATLSVISSMFPEHALRRRAIAVWAAVGGAGGMTGPVIGGWLVEHSSWRAAFWINVPFALATAVLALLYVPGSRGARTGPIDLSGAALSAGGLLTLIWAIIEAPVRGWTSLDVLTAFTSAAVLLAAFAWQQSRSPHPMVPPAVLRRPGVAAAAAALALMSFALFGALFVTTLYLQGVLHYTPWQAGLRTLPLPAGLAVGATVSPPLMARYTPKVAVIIGLATVAISFVYLTGTQPASGYAHLVIFQAIAGFGAGLTAAAATETVMNAVPQHQAGLGSAVNDATRQVGSALGVAVQGSVLAQTYTDRFSERLTATGTLSGLFHTTTDNIAAVTTAAARLPVAQQRTVLAAAEDAFLTGMTRAALVAVAAAMLGMGVAWLGSWASTGTSPTAPGRRGARKLSLRKRMLTAGVHWYMATVMVRPTSREAMRVPSPDGRYGSGTEPALPLVLLGDSLAVGVGTQSPEETGGAQLAAALVEHLDGPVDLKVCARAGSTSWSLRGQTLRMPPGDGVAVIIVGGNDVLLPVRVVWSARRLQHTITDLRRRQWSVVVVTCPDYRGAHGLRSWVRGTAIRRSQRLIHLQRHVARQAGAHVIDLPIDEFLRDPATILSDDGCHPSATGYALHVAYGLPTVVRASRGDVPL